MDAEKVKAALAEIQVAADRGDGECAHILEDNLRDDVLEAIASGTLSAKWAAELAKLALSSHDIDFYRHYA